MKKYSAIILTILSLFPFTFFAYEQIIIRLNMQDDYQSIQFNKLDFGIHPLATTGLDTALGEQDLPPFIPPDGLHGVFLIDDSIRGDNLWSYINLMPIPNSNDDSVIFRFEVHNIVQALNFSWLPLPSNIISAYIRDRYTGNIIKISMKDSLSAKVNNKSITRFEIIARFDVSTHIDYINKENKLKISSNPTSAYLTIYSDFTINDYKIYSILGELVETGNINNDNAIIDVNRLTSGIYLLQLNTWNGEFITKRFIKF
jgi:hypothetical protein